MSPVAEDRLPCGARVDELLDQVAEGRPPRDPAHQARCPHCRAALAHLTEVWAPVQDLAQEEVRAPADLLQTVMAGVRELARDGWSAVLDGTDGRTRIAARVVGAVARLAAESVPHVSQALGGGRVGAAGARVVVDVQVVVDHGAPIPAVAARVREQVVRHLAAQTGLTATAVDVTVVDVRTHPD